MVAINFYMNRVKGLFQRQEMTAEEFGNTDPRYADYTFITTETVSGDAVNSSSPSVRTSGVPTSWARKGSPHPMAPS